jgi:hypothetical protein
VWMGWCMGGVGGGGGGVCVCGGGGGGGGWRLKLVETPKHPEAMERAGE